MRHECGNGTVTVGSDTRASYTDVRPADPVAADPERGAPGAGPVVDRPIGRSSRSSSSPATASGNPERRGRWDTSTSPRWARPTTRRPSWRRSGGWPRSPGGHARSGLTALLPLLTGEAQLAAHSLPAGAQRGLRGRGQGHPGPARPEPGRTSPPVPGPHLCRRRSALHLRPAAAGPGEEVVGPGEEQQLYCHCARQRNFVWSSPPSVAQFKILIFISI